MSIERLKNLTPLCTTQEILDYPKLQVPREQTPLYIVATDWKNLDWDSTTMTVARFCALYFALPFFAVYTSIYNAGASITLLASSGVLLFRKEDGDDARALAANAVQHIAIIAYDLFCGLYVTASLLYVPVLPALYAFAPEPIQRAHNYLIDKESGLLTARTKEFIINLLTKKEESPATPAPPSKSRWRMADFSPTAVAKYTKKLIDEFTTPSKSTTVVKSPTEVLT